MAFRVGELGCGAEKIRVCELGVDLAECEVRPRRRAEGEPLKVLAAARFVEKKGLPDAVRAVEAAARQVNIELTVVGRSPGNMSQRRETARIHKAVSKAKVRVMDRMPLDELRRLAHQHHVFLIVRRAD